MTLIDYLVPITIIFLYLLLTLVLLFILTVPLKVSVRLTQIFLNQSLVIF